MRRVEPSGNLSASWSDAAFGATEFLFADYRDFVFPAHVHETFAIGVIEAGGQRFRPGRAPALVMPAGTLCAINPGVVHDGRSATEQGWRYRMFYPSPALVASELEHSQRGPLSGDWGLAHHVIADRELYREFLALHLSSQFNEILLERQTRIGDFLRRLFERHGNFSPERNQPPVAPRTVARVREYLHSMYQRQVSIDDLAQAAGVTGTQVIRAFSAGIGMPPHAYLVSLRVERAKGLLREGRSPAEVALDAGFYDQSQLTRHFKRLTGVTPGQFAAQSRRAGKESTRFRAAIGATFVLSEACAKSI
jgi:AraC-like DNA-binding protein